MDDPMNLERLVGLNVGWLTDRLLDYAGRGGLPDSSGKRREAREALVRSVADRLPGEPAPGGDCVPGASPDPGDDRVVAFGRAQVSPGSVRRDPLMVPCLVKYLRMSFSDLLLQSREKVSSCDPEMLRIRAFFDRMELGVCLGLAECRPKSGEDYGPLFESMPDGLAILRLRDGDGDYCFQRVNPSFGRLSGAGREELLGRPLAEVLPDLFGRSHEALPKALVSGDKVQTEVFSERLGGHFQLTMFPFSGRRAVLVLSDVSDRKALEVERERRQRLESLGSLAGELAHEFNNMMMGVTGSVSMALERAEEDGLAGHLRDALREAERAKRTLNSLLTLASGGAPVTATRRLEELVEESARLALSGSPVRLEMRSDPDLPPAEVDRAQLIQAVGCIVANARDAMPEGGLLAVTLRTAESCAGGQEVTISFRDTGEGIDAEDLERVFYPNYSTRPGRSGLGLTVARSIVRRHGGEVSAESDGAGTVMTITLPASEGEVPESEGEPEVSGGAPPRVLVMDDDGMVREVASGMLSQMGCTVCGAEDGAAALREVRTSPDGYDLVIADLTVPGGRGGVWLARRLAEESDGIRVVASSGYHDRAAMSDHASHGFHDVIPKPYGMEELRELLRRVCGYVPSGG
jgi:signal transduction histidine kinase